ncbi:MAG: hypothetical protein ACRENL_05295 [Candidatus Dormibacteria bacterium]
MTGPSAVDRSALWLPLLRRLTAESPTWVTWKSADAALHGYGDVDSTAAAAERPAIESMFAGWAAAQGLGPVIVCRHAPDLDVLVALSGDEPFIELDVMPRKVFLGSTMFTHQDVLALSEMDPRGFRRVHPGAEGLLKLLLNGTHRNGLPDHRALRARRIARLLATDARGVRLMAARFGPAEGAALDLATAVVGGGWDRRAALRVEGWFLARALLEPRLVGNKLRFRVAKRRCPVLRAMAAGRRVPEPAQAWLRRARVGHRVYG